MSASNTLSFLVVCGMIEFAIYVVMQMRSQRKTQLILAALYRELRRQNEIKREGGTSEEV